MDHQFEHILLPLAQREQVDGQGLEAEKQVAAAGKDDDLGIGPQRFQTWPLSFGRESRLSIHSNDPPVIKLTCNQAAENKFSNLLSAEKARSLGIRGFALKTLATMELAALIRKVLDNGGSGVS